MRKAILNKSTKDWDGDVCLQPAERLEALRQLANNEKCNVSAPWGRFNYLTDNTATVYPNTQIRMWNYETAWVM